MRHTLMHFSRHPLKVKSVRVAGINIVVSYPVPGGNLLPAVGPTSFEVGSGEFVCLVGPSGCGKSTLIRAIAGLQRPSQGHIILGEDILSKPSPQIGMMFQDANLMPWRTVIDNVALPLELAGMDKPTRYAVSRELLHRLGLEGYEGVYPGSLSGGMAQRVALGRVLSARPEVLLLDEPFGALDALTREQVSFDLLRVWSDLQQTVLMVTHDIQEAVMLSDRVLVMSRRPGRFIADIRVPLGRPRQQSDAFTPIFIETAKQVREALNLA
jgi:NitT/TauT family transport system ATP-binding protein